MTQTARAVLDTSTNDDGPRPRANWRVVVPRHGTAKVVLVTAA